MRFAAKPRKLSSVTEIVIHESVTGSRASTERVLASKGYGVHVSIDGDGSIVWHNPLSDRLIHCAGHNGPSVGVEIVNPYSPRHLRPGAPWRESVFAPWAHGGEYVLATLPQCAALVEVIGQLLADTSVRIPAVWHGAADGRWLLSEAPGSDRLPGIWSHQQIGKHADGSWPALVAYLAICHALPVAEAWQWARSAAVGARRSIALPEPP